MADAIRAITVEQGLDPRDFTLVAYGGAGPMHAVFLAEELEIQRVIVPHSPGTFSAGGMLQTDIQHDVVQTMYRRADEATAADVASIFVTLESRARAILENDGVASERMRMLRSAEMRYVGQEYAVQIAFPNNAFDATALEKMPELFHAAHNVRYGHCNPQEAVEYVNLRITAVGVIDKPPLTRFEPNRRSRAIPFTSRQVIFEGVAHDTRVYDRARLEAGDRFGGPAIVEEPSATTVIPPDHTVTIDELMNLDIQ
jgi:N-methylhydantoinase A